MPDDANGFFTNVASRLLASDLGLPLTRIELYPANQYTPAVHRLLQLTANLYDATTNRFPVLNGTNPLQAPTVFRPIFRRNPGPDPTNVFIAGYREVTQLRPVLASLMRPVNLEDGADRLRLLPAGTPFRDDGSELMASGIPLVIGAKKGFPNFNKFALENSLTATRRLRFHRELLAPVVSWTNQAFSLAMTSSFGVQAWNSYSNDYVRRLTLIVAGDVSLALTNELGAVAGPEGSPLANTVHFAAATNIIVWPGFQTAAAATSNCFLVPLLTNYLFLSNSVFVHDQNRFFNAITNDASNYFPLPKWWLSLTTRLRVLIVDSDSRRILDYVNLCAAESPLNILGQMRETAPCDGNLPSISDPYPGSLWCTNRLGNPREEPAVDDPTLPTYGIMNQLEISMGLPAMVSDAFWRDFNGETNDKRASIETFDNRMFGDPQMLTSPEDLDFAAPFSPKRTLYQYLQWEANDPLVHYTLPDLTDQMANTNRIQWDNDRYSPVSRLRAANPLADHYRPWGGNPRHYYQDPTPFLLSIKDPLAWRSDDWDFPSGEPLSLIMIGRVHRGTPWQTVYLKSAGVDLNLWKVWTGIGDDSTARATLPTNDWHLATWLGLILNATDPRELVSINDPDTNAWLEILDGITVITNSSPPVELVMSSNSPQAALIANALQQTRSDRLDQQFIHLGEILATPQVSVGSPWLKVAGLNDPNLSATDQACEMIPSQLLSRVRENPVGAIVPTGNQACVQFSGYDHFRYVIETSSDLRIWFGVSTNSPSYGVFGLSIAAPAADGPHFYRAHFLR